MGGGVISFWNGMHGRNVKRAEETSMIRQFTRMACVVTCILASVTYAQQLLQPESAVYDMPRDRYLISNFYNGQIIAISAEGTYSVFAEGKISSAGLHIIDDTVYVGCGTRGVLAYNLVTGEEVMDILIPGSSLLNDITADTSGNLYVSDPYGNKIYRIRLADRTYSTLVDYVVWPNGLLFDKKNNRLLACTSTTRRIYSVDMTDGTLTQLVNVGDGHLDGLAEDNAGNIYVSAQGPEAVFRYNWNFTSSRETVSSGHVGPADIYYDRWHEILLVPNIAGNTVDFVDMPVPPRLEIYTFSDVTYGDGDGLWEGGEEIELTFGFENSRPESMINMTVNLFSEDISLTVTSGTVDLGDVVPEQIVDNTSAPFRFTIPAEYNPRIDSFYLEFNYTFMAEDRRDTIVITQGIGHPRILLVDDFAGAGIAHYYTQELDDLLIPYTVWDIQAEGTPSSAALSEYEVVIWFTGNDGAAGFDNDKILSLQGYMDGGGSLFLTGQGIAAAINAFDPGFLNNYLRCTHESILYVMLMTIASTAEVFAQGDTLMISGGDGASNQVNTDHISALNGAVDEMNYFGTANGGAVSYAGDYKLVFFGFGFEAVRSDMPRFISRQDILLNIFDFFELPYPNRAPAATDLTISPGDPTHLVNHTPEISWNYLDEDMTPQAYYQIQVGDDDLWPTGEMWDSGPVPGSEASVVYSGSELQDGGDYYVRARSSDGSLWSNWVYGSFHMNAVPVPADLVPDNAEEVATNPPLLSHATMTDSEADSLTYDYQLYDDAAMTVPVENASGLPGMPGDTTSWQVATPLTEYEDYYWRVRCQDNYETGSWSAVASFIVVPPFICGDANRDETLNVGDAVFIINYVFKSGPAPDPLAAGDANSDGTTDVGDAVYLVNFIFRHGPDPCSR